MKYLTVRQFADIFEVHVHTVKNWQKQGLIEDKRNPINNYRYFTIEDVKKVQKLLGGSI